MVVNPFTGARGEDTGQVQENKGSHTNFSFEHFLYLSFIIFQVSVHFCLQIPHLLKFFYPVGPLDPHCIEIGGTRRFCETSTQNVKKRMEKKLKKKQNKQRTTCSIMHNRKRRHSNH
ncbi:hypothetical protein, unlikely [Trypanosoma brucei gambiense DAL972]|uniref:Uncharacterized protein n=1 Tax=Trypanosoma brucei gambiense (strain MHOM/CI/86/DAL972) TaxID=679716 RepID=C9ZTM5_TRYB9|nr:hypothetical protein, unlikely [Trypanosoma brucei gambiense DAL972]CBH12760.1 hypothetical protein, unlikely [Trypanosoma brucei gambiense DAL972]|eukprot:XP_011775040.1 hypothetical protein, unlikely [Trypanosoma brucei gambiense DAL972]